MKKTFLIVAALVSFTAFAFAGDALSGFEITIDIAPNVLNLQRTDDKCVTVHTDIPYSEVDCTSVTLEAGDDSIILPYSCFSDDRGDFVAKFSMEAVRGLSLTTGAYNIFKLTGKTKEIDDVVSEFWGIQNILVIDGPKGP